MSGTRVGDWEVDDLLFWRALESHPPLGGILRQVLSHGWTLCIPPDTAIPLGGPNAEPRPTESFARMHVLVPSSSSNNNDCAASESSAASSSSAPSGGRGALASSFAKVGNFFSSFGSPSSLTSSPMSKGSQKLPPPRQTPPSQQSASPPPPPPSAFPPSTITRFYAAGRKDAIVLRKPTSAIEEDEEDLIFEDEEESPSSAHNNNSCAKSATTLRSICKRHRFNDDKNSRDLASADLGVLVAEGPAFGGMRTVARIVFEQKVSTESKKTVTVLVLDRALNAGPHAVPAHLRTFGFTGQTVSDAVEFLFDADSEFVADEQSLFTRLQKRAAETREAIDTKLAPLLQLADDESRGPIEITDIDEAIDHSRDVVNNLVSEEHTRWKNAIVPAAYPLSCRRLDRSFFVALSCYVHSRVYQVIHSLFLHQSGAEVEAWKAVREKFDDVAGGDDDPVHLGLAPELWVRLRKFDAQIGAAVQRALDSVGAATNPFDKMQRLDQLVCAAAQMPAGAPKLTADDVVPLLAYYLLRSPRCENLPVHVAYVKALATEDILGGVWSSHEYSLATLEVAMSVALNVFEQQQQQQMDSTHSSSAALGAGGGGGAAAALPQQKGLLPGEVSSQTRFEQSVIRSTQSY